MAILSMALTSRGDHPPPPPQSGGPNKKHITKGGGQYHRFNPIWVSELYIDLSKNILYT
jgi:hypothetical protein